MHIILMSERQGRTVALHIGRRHGLALAGLLVCAFCLSVLLGFQFGQGDSVPGLPGVAGGQRVDQLAIRIGELQARLARVRDIGERVAKKVGIPLTDTANTDPPGRGGPALSVQSRPANAQELARMLDDLTRQIDHESDRLTLLDADLLTRDARQGRLPMDRPVGEEGYVSSSFGLRPDPFTGRLSRHEGFDFADEPGAPILAAESGVVIAAQSSVDYGNMIDIDHGNGVTTRYGHCARLLVKQGDVVKRGQKIAEVGSTGRSTGPHVHFEVRKNGVAQNPLLYLSRQF